MTKAKTLSVRLNGTPVGNFIQTAQGRMQFKYLSDATRQISLSLPTRSEAYSHRACEAYFAGLLPESSHAKKAIALQFNANPNSVFSMLAAIGHDCAGAISFDLPDSPVVDEARLSCEIREVSEAELAKHIEELPQRPLFIGVDGLRLSLAGVQDKAAVFVKGGKIYLPQSGTPTSHILKPGSARFPSLVQNEYLCMRAASRVGLTVPKVELRSAKKNIFLLVERYDRELQDTAILRVHQEDFCQALGNREKYQHFGGPGLKDCFDLLNRSALPVVDRNFLMQAVIFNYLIGNSDAHGKNFSIIHRRSATMRMAPLYDLVCTQIYPNLGKEMSMRLGQQYRFNNVRLDDWKELAKDVGFSFPQVRQMLKRYSTDLPVALAEERKNITSSQFDASELDSIVKFVAKNCLKTLQMLEKD